MIVIKATIQEGHETYPKRFEVNSDIMHGLSCKEYVEACLNQYNRNLPDGGIARELLLINDVLIEKS